MTGTQALVAPSHVRKGKVLDRGDWAHYKPVGWRHKAYESQKVEVIFKDGLQLCVQISGRNDKPINWGRAWRVAQQFRKGKLAYQAGKRTLAEITAFERRLKPSRITSLRSLCGHHCKDVRNAEMIGN